MAKDTGDENYIREITDAVKLQFGQQYGMCNLRFKGIEDAQIEIKESTRAMAESQEVIADSYHKQAVEMAELRAKVLNGLNIKIKNNSRAVLEQKQRVNKLAAVAVGILVTTVGTLIATLTLLVSMGG